MGKLIPYVRAVDNMLNTSSYFIGDYDITDKTADSLTAKLNEYLHKSGID